MVRHWRASSPRSWSSSSTKTSGRVSSRSQPSQLANAGRSAIDSAPGVAGRERGDGAGVDHQPPPARCCRTWSVESRGRTFQSRPSSSGPTRLRSRSRRKYGGSCRSWPAAGRRRRPRRGRPGAGCGGVRRQWWSCAGHRPGRRRRSRRRGSGTPPARPATTGAAGAETGRRPGPAARSARAGQVGAGHRADQQRPPLNTPQAERRPTAGS